MGLDKTCNTDLLPQFKVLVIMMKMLHEPLEYSVTKSIQTGSKNLN